MKQFLSAETMTKKEIMNLIELAIKLREQPVVFSKQLFAANLFFEPSTRTKMSFTIAEKRLGMEPLDFSAETSSVKKGETLYDTAKTFEAIGADVLIIRHVEDEWAKELEQKINIPVINAGAGKKEHPTQSLLDAMTIYEEFNTFEGLKVVISGDVKHSRVARSNAAFLSKLGAELYIAAPAEYTDTDLPYPVISMDEAVEIADVLMLLRIQNERHTVVHLHDANYLNHFGLTKERERKMKKQSIIMHPGPVNRGVEIDTDLVECPRSRIFKQMSNGVFVRMAAIMSQLLEWGILHEDQIIESKCNQEQQVAAMRCVN